MNEKNSILCPCCSGDKYETCCLRFHVGKENAGTAEELMRSRYTANVFKDVQYLLNTWHPDQRPKSLDRKAIPDWTSLQILRTEAGLRGDSFGIVEFKAIAAAPDAVHHLHEISRFVEENNVWFYTDGDIVEANSDWVKTGRNELCPCGSGRKFKKCCRK